MPRKKTAQAPTPRRPAIVLQLEPHRYAVAVSRRDEDGERVYEIVHDNIREAKIAATLARTSEGEVTQP